MRAYYIAVNGQFQIRENEQKVPEQPLRHLLVSQQTPGPANAEATGFEPARLLHPTAFKAVSLGHSDTPPWPSLEVGADRRQTLDEGQEVGSNRNSGMMRSVLSL